MLHDTTSTSSRRDRAGTRAMNFVRYRSPQGFTVRTPLAATSFVFRVTRVISCCKAVAASNPSMTGNATPAAMACAVIRPHWSATARSMGRTIGSYASGPPAHIRPTCASQISHSQDSSAVADMLHLLHPHIPTCMKPHWALRRELHLLGR